MRIPGHQKRSYTWRWTAALGGLAVVTFALVMALVVTPAERVQALNLTVNLTTDVADVGDTSGDGAFDLGETADGTCDTDNVTAGSQCTLRAAIFEANGNGDTADTITFGSLSGTINIGSLLPVGDSDPSVAGIDGLAANTTIDGNGTLTVDGGAFNCFEVTSPTNVIRDLTITGCADGIFISTDDADANAVRGNTIHGNTDDGVEISQGDGNTVGGTSALDRNVIRDNGDDGVFVGVLGTDGNIIAGNCIGTLANCSVAAPNSGDGVEINGSNNRVGGTAAGAGNTIAFNGGDGVNIAGGTGNVITRNVMFLNTGFGITSGFPTPTLLGGCADAGGGNVSCTGMASAPGDIVDVYRANVDLLPEGDLFLCTAIAGGGGAWGCTFPNPGGGSATATERTAPAGNTSMFSFSVGIPVGPAATPTSAPTSTPTPGSPTATPTRTRTPTATGTPPTATPTATPVMESVTLVVGCNPLASTYPENTAVTTLGAAVSPAGALVSIWKFETGVWRGYSPDYPALSDLSEVDRLDVVFICVDRAGSFARPKV